MDRAASVAAASTTWGAHLRSVGDRGSLTRTDSSAALSITDADPAALAALFAGRPVRLRSLIRDRAGHAAALRRARAIRDDVRDIAEQHGIAAGALAVGVATWTSPTGAERVGPLLLRPLSIIARTASEDDFELSLGTSYTLNRGLVEELATGYNVTLDASRAADVATADPTAPAEFYDRIGRESVSVPHFTVSHQLVVGTHTHAAARLASDLAAVGELLAHHPVVAALAGLGASALPAGTGSLGESPAGSLAGSPAESSLAESQAGSPAIDLTGSDRIDPALEYLAVDADAPASAAIAAVLAGGHLAIEGAPGTGRTSTTANLIAALTAAGRTALVLSENRTVASELLARLASAGLGDLALDTGGDLDSGSRRLAAAAAAATHPLPPAPDVAAVARQLRDARDHLRSFAESLHGVREPWGFSVYAAQAALLGLPAEAATRVRFPADVLAALHGDTLAEAQAAVQEWARLGGTTLTGLDTPWYGARVGSAADAQDAQRLATELATATYPAARAALERTLAEAGLAPVASVADWRPALTLLRGVAETERLLSAEVWQAPLPELVAATSDAGYRGESAHRPGWQDRMAARRMARRLWQGDKPVGSELPDALARAAAQRVEWSRLAMREGAPRERTSAPAPPRAPRAAPDLDATDKAYARLLDGLAALQLLLPDRDFPRLAPAVLEKTLHGLANDPVLHRLPRLGELAARCSALGLRPFLLDLHTRRFVAELAPTAFEHAWLASVLAQVAGTDPAYGSFDAAALSVTVERYRQADWQHLASTGARLRRRVRERTAAAAREHPEQVAAVRSGAGKAGPSGIRRLLEEAPDVALAAVPCWVASPYAVAEVLPPEQLFDVVIVQDANAVSVPVAVPGLARGRYVVLVGDRRQLPPLELADERPPDGLGGMGEPRDQRHRQSSVLDALAPVLPRVNLQTYHRRTDERLIGFIAATVYSGSLISTPSPDRSDRLTYVPVPHRSGTPGQEDSVTAEVQKVVGLVIDHAVRYPDVSFGVVTLGQRHAERIAAALRVALVGRPELGDVFRGDAPERFFIKPCSRLAGDLRDVILFSTGLGKTPEGRVSYRFGPLDGDGAERLLTVGLTRARRRLTLITSMSSADLDPARLSSAGPRLLRALLRYAEVPELRRTPYAEPPPPDGFELDLRNRLRTAGLPVVAEVGLGRCRVSLALAAPDDAARLVLAVETDGPQWAGLPTVRDRDRLRGELLTGLGWAVCRVHATQWFRDPDAEVARVRAAYEAALASAG